MDEPFDIEFFGSTLYVSGRASNNVFAVPVGVSTSFPILPVELIKFTARKEGEAVSLRWLTASESNNMGFELERSADAASWETLDFIHGNGTTSSPQTYQYVDETPMSGHNYYRLKQIDFNGQFEYSDIVVVYIDNQQSTFNIFPNPVTKDHFQLQFSETLNATVEVYDLTGRLLYSQLIKNRNTMELGPLPAGIYTIQYTSEGIRQTQKLQVK